MIRSLLATSLAVWLAQGQAAPQPRSDSDALVGSWTLTSMQRPGGAVANPRGLLVFDAVGHVCEIASAAGIPLPAGAQASPQEALATFMNYGGFWGAYRADGAQGRVTYRAESALNPGIEGRDLIRAYRVSGDTLTITSLAGEPITGAGATWVWTRVPPVDGVSPAHRRLVGFWRETSERTTSIPSGAVLAEAQRGPSVIAYTPSSLLCVHFPRAGRKPFAGEVPTPDEAKSALAGYTSYIAALAVHPGFIFHHQLLALAPSPASSLQRFYEFADHDNEVNYLFPPTVVGGQQRRTQVVLRRLSGAADMR